MTVYEKMGLKRVVNSAGRLTSLGVSTPVDEVVDAMTQAAQNYVVIDDLLDKCGELIASYTHAEAACVASSTSAAICLSCAGLMTGTDSYLIAKLPDTTGLKNEFILQGGHNIHFGTCFEQLIRTAGGKPVVAGSANLVHDYDIEGCITDKTAAIIYVKSHHCVQHGMVSLEDTIAIAHKHNLPVLMDASAEEDLFKYYAAGVDLVCYSGAKAICGPTSGFVIGKKKYIEAVRKQYMGFGRVMKIGKENAVGLTKAVELYVTEDKTAYKENCKKEAEYLLNELKDCKGIKASMHKDEAGRDIVRVNIEVTKDCKYTVKELLEKLRNGNPSIQPRAHELANNSFMFDFRPLIKGDVELIANAMKEILK